MGLEQSQQTWLALVREAAAGRADIAEAMRKLIAEARREDPEHPAWEHVDDLDFAADAKRLAAGVTKILASRKLKPDHGEIVFELDPVNLAGDGGINVFAGREGGDIVDLGVVGSRVLGKLYDWAEDGDAADILVGLGFTAVAIARATGKRKTNSRRITIAYHDSDLDPIVLGEPLRVKEKKAPRKPKPKATKPARVDVPKSASPAEWLLRAAKFGDANAAAKAAIRAVEASDKPAAKTALTALAAALKRPTKESYDRALAAIGALYFVAERLGERGQMKQATQLAERVVKATEARYPADDPYRNHVRRRATQLFERYKRGIKNGGEIWFFNWDEIPREVWLPFLDGVRGRLDGDVARCRAALKKLDAEVARALKEPGMRKRLLNMAGDYAMLHGFCGNAAKVREILSKFRDESNGPKPKQAIAALFDAGDKKSAAALAARELRERLDEVTGKAGVIAAMNAHHSLLQLQYIFEAQLKAGDRDGVARGLDAVGKALAKARRNSEARAWALKTVAEMEMRIGRPDRARAANELAEKIAAKARGAEIRSMSWRGVAEVYAKLGEWENAQAAIAKVPSRHEKLGATITMLIYRGDMDQVAREIAKMKGKDAKRHACEYVAEVLEERPSSPQ